MKKLIALLFALFPVICQAQYYILFNNGEQKQYLESNDPFQQVDGYVTRFSVMSINQSKETIINQVEKPDYILSAEAIYTNSLTTIGLPGCWTNMDYTFESVGIFIVQKMMEYIQSGDVENANLMSTYKGVIKDAYEVLLKFAKQYGIDDMRLYPYESTYIINERKEYSYIEYNSERYWNLKGPEKYVPEENNVEPVSEEPVEK